MSEQPTERDWLEGLRYEDKFPDPTPEQETFDPLRPSLRRLKDERDEARAECDRLRAERDRVGEVLTQAQARSNSALAAARDLAEAVEEAYRCLTLIGHAGKKWSDKALAAERVLCDALARFREATKE